MSLRRNSTTVVTSVHRLPLLTNEIRGVDKLVTFSDMLVNSTHVDNMKAQGEQDPVKADE